MSHQFVPGIASQSLGCPQYHGIHDKLQAAAGAGLRSVEIFFEDIRQLAIAQRSNPSMIPQSTRSLSRSANTQHAHLTKEQQEQLLCARQIRGWCKEAYRGARPLDIICLQPFMHFEGLLDPQERHARFEKLNFWIQVAEQLGTDLIQIPSNFLSQSECTGDRSRLIADLREAAKIGAAQSPPIRFAYEALCWGTHINTWDAAWSIVEEVDMLNFGTCLDTFNIAGRVHADPEALDGKNADADADMSRSIQLLKDTFSDPEKLKKVFYVELCDGERLDAPLDPDHEWYDANQPSRMTWSRNARLYPFETDSKEAAAQDRRAGYLPVTQIFDALLDVGYTGYLSFEVFNRSLNQESSQVIATHAERVSISWERCAEYIDNRLAQRDTRNTKESTSTPEDNSQLILSDILDIASTNVISSRFTRVPDFTTNIAPRL
ncbi:hypothetical protein LTS08_001918 [Lithohypha guttulata]|nr:hypothetical protein LTS08_001918 [Lithohypha guttulata]